ncbi:MAG TPA: arabinan endo-1,5-alpha-L-arabinosidase [Acidimicrobiales bacterium]|nr:arabinan endo-1,5-alpha-L-arabinosidase [Acidimicrobiales bacterium]
MRSLALLLVAGLAATVALPAQAAVPPESCALVYPVATSCTYVAADVASFVGTGPFHLRVSYTDSRGRSRTRYDIDSPAGEATVIGTTDARQIGIGDTVEGEVLGPGGALGIGNPGAVPHSPVRMVEAPRLDGDTTQVHDPAIVASRGWYYVYSTGPGIPIRRSKDLVRWESAGRVFGANSPPWAPQLVPGTEFPWAPDLSFFAGRWHLYYAVSTFGSKRAVIGLATNVTLDPSDRRFGWRDEGPVLDSRDLADPSGLPSDYVALDPNVVRDASGTPHLVFGSFYGGLRSLRLNPASGRPVLPLLPVPLATNVQEYTGVEAGYMINRHGWYYLFASYDYCCRGTDSTYNVRVGRSRSINGPFIDDLGIPMLAGGGRYVLVSHGDMRGPGHNSVLRRGNRFDIVFHWYDAANSGIPTLGILPLRWTADGWPVARD